jgi:hypothetical protein
MIACPIFRWSKWIAPEISSVVRGVRMLRGEYVFPELEELREREQKVLLVAATVLFVENNVCFS